MAKKKSSSLASLISFIAWLTGIIVSLAVGVALINGGLAVPYIGMVNVVAGWIVVFTTLLGALLVIINKVK
ncbi:hypothetical protein KY314_04000 [Candidatus Woesearchaeota archaeon]|nr:hypothetical protein [Candidatus Woesearchaeota archaeon]